MISYYIIMMYLLFHACYSQMFILWGVVCWYLLFLAKC